MTSLSRRAFLRSSASAAVLLPLGCAGPGEGETAPRMVDLHQHVPYGGRPAEGLLAHQRALGAGTTILLPAGRLYGLAGGVGSNDDALEVVRGHPREYAFFANELPDILETREVLEKYLRSGAIGIGEQKFPVACDSKGIHLVAEIAREFDVPVLLHFQHETYNTGFERFHKVIERHPRVNFIGHAQTWWGHIDRNHEPRILYPKGPVTPGGLTDRYLSDYPNLFGDLSAGSGQNALKRDEEHAREFLKRHQDKLLFGSDCTDSDGRLPKCIGTGTLELLRRLAPDEIALRKILYGNALRILRLPSGSRR